MKILYLLFSFTTGGTERLVSDICNEMANREHNIHLYIVNNLVDQNMLDTLDPRISVLLQKRPVGGKDKLRTLFKIAHYIRENKIDVVHCNSFAAPELLLLKPFYFPRTKIIHTIHDVGQYQSLNFVKRYLRNLLCHRFIAISNCVREDIISHGAKPDKVHVVYNAIDLTRFMPQQLPAKDTIRIGQVARIMPEKKGQDLLIDAMELLHKKHPKLECFFAGDADAAHQEAFSALKKSVNDAALTGCITFLGNLVDVPSFLATLDIFVLPSRYEGFGISLVEALAMGIPCVASHLDGPAEVLQNGKFGILFTPNDSKDLAEKLDNMINDLTSCKEKAVAAVPYIRKAYNIVNMCDRLEQIMCE